MIFMPDSSASWLGLSDSFWGALIGAGITGIFAICVFALGKYQEEKNKRKYLDSVKWLLNHVHTNTEDSIEEYIKGYRVSTEMSEAVHNSITKIIEHENYLKHMDYQNLIIEPIILKNTVRYIGAFEYIVNQLKDHNNNNYGYVFLDIDKVRTSFSEMRVSIQEINKK